MKFWDSSAIVCLLANQPASSWAKSLQLRDGGLWVWWGTKPEAASALARLSREGALNLSEHEDALERLEAMTSLWSEVAPGELLRETALRLLRVHPLRAGDALQLAAAYTASEHRPSTLEFVCLDKRLAEAASREGFVVNFPVPV